MAFIELGAPRRGRLGAVKDTSCLTVVKGGRPEASMLSLQVTISAAAMAQMRWLIGDGVTLAFDDKDPLLVLVKRVQKGGRTISSAGGKADHGASNKRGLVKFAMPAHFQFKWQDTFYCDKPDEQHGGLVFQFKAA